MSTIIKPIITEKLTDITEEFPNRYGFVVDRNANKRQIKQAVEDLYDVTVLKVNTMNYTGKNHSRFTKSGLITGRSNAYKKAIVTLEEGEIIDFYSNI